MSNKNPMEAIPRVAILPIENIAFILENINTPNPAKLEIRENNMAFVVLFVTGFELM